MTALLIEYQFSFDDGRQLTYPVSIDSQSMTLLEAAGEEFPDWALLEHFQCPNCPLTADEHPYCPVAKNLHLLVTATQHEPSNVSTEVTVTTADRSYKKDTDLQTGLFSLMGLLIVSSKCPHFDLLKPLARFHLPFATLTETLYRTCGSYLLDAYLNDRVIEPDLGELKRYYQNLGQINTCILERIKSVSEGDADRNAIVTLNMFTQMFVLESETNFSILTNIFKGSNSSS
jgi:hypothetical protein